jgi:hypothetical protein
MMGRQENLARLFCELNLDRHVPSDHMLREINLLPDENNREWGSAAPRTANFRPNSDCWNDVLTMICKAGTK